MIPTFELFFGQNLIKGLGDKISDNKIVIERCHEFTIVDAVKVTSPHQLMPGKCINKPWLYGPAMCLETKTIIYPCSRFRCQIPCPCLLCAKQLPKCHFQKFACCGCTECTEHFEDHSLYHATYHFGCKSCSQLLIVMPMFNFFFLTNERPKFPYGQTDPIQIKPLIVELEPKNPPENSIQELMMIKRNESTWCLTCNALFWSIGQLKEHIQLNHLVSKLFRHTYENISKQVSEDFKCIQCPISFSSNSHLDRHVESEHYQLTYTCDLCDDQFKRMDNLMRHKKTHDTQDESEIQTYDCEICNKSFGRKDALIRHKKTAHEVSNDKFTCNECGKQFTRPSHLNRHMTVHQVEVNMEVSCEFCDKAFAQKGNLQRHLRTRNSTNCSECGENFCNVKSLSMHKNDVHVHAECDQCGNKFERKYLNHHKIMAHEHIKK